MIFMTRDIIIYALMTVISAFVTYLCRKCYFAEVHKLLTKTKKSAIMLIILILAERCDVYEIY